MSFQRAEVSCKRCYDLSHSPLSFLYGDGIFEARIQALTALERVQDHYLSFEPDKEAEIFMTDLGLKKCLVCAANGKKSPEIAELVMIVSNHPQQIAAQDSRTSSRLPRT